MNDLKPGRAPAGRQQHRVQYPQSPFATPELQRRVSSAYQLPKLRSSQILGDVERRDDGQLDIGAPRKASDQLGKIARHSATSLKSENLMVKRDFHAGCEFGEARAHVLPIRGRLGFQLSKV